MILLGASFRLLAAAVFLTVVAYPVSGEAALGPFTRSTPTPAEELLRRVAERYATAGSYADTGTVETAFRSRRTWSNQKTFKTFFSRAGLFHFEFEESFLGSKRRYVVWGRGANIQSWWTLEPKVEHFTSISEAIAGPTGVSSGSAHTVPTLLLGVSGGGWHITSLKAPQIVGRQIVGSQNCYVVRGEHPRTAQMFSLWIDESAISILRIQSQVRLDDGTEVQTTTEYHPEFGVAVTDADIAFIPPP
jgi:hypothetical protein